jgi:hypothetical protein
MKGGSMKQVKNFCRNLAVIGLFLLVVGTGTALGNTSYSGSGVLYLSQVEVLGDGMYEVFLKAVDKNGQEFYLQSATPVISGQPADATFDPATGQLHILDLMIFASGNTKNHVSVEMVQVPDSDPLRFRVMSVIGLNLPYGSGGSSTIAGIIGPRGDIILGSGFSVSAEGPGFYAVDFGMDVSRFVCSCTMSEERGIATNKLYNSYGAAGCIIIKGGDFLVKDILELPVSDFNSSHTILFEFPYGTSGFHFICMKF